MEALIEAINTCPIVHEQMLVGWQLGKYCNASLSGWSQLPRCEVCMKLQLLTIAFYVLIMLAA